jgi:proline dehydrogenase
VYFAPRAYNAADRGTMRVEFPPATGQAEGTGWGVAKTSLLMRANFRQPLVVRGRRIDGSGDALPRRVRGQSVGPPAPRIRGGVSVFDKAIVQLLPAVPKQVVRLISDRYIAGTELDDACRVVKELNAHGKMATIDVLGEEITSAREARAIATNYEDVFRTIGAQELDANVSVKPTALGLNLDYSVFRANLEHVVELAAVIGNFVRIDMEDSSTTDDTLRAYRELREAGHENVGVVLQACLRRTVDDIRALADLGLNVRICKGIYVEPPEIAYQGFQEVRGNFMLAVNELLSAGGYVGIATHDEWLLRESQVVVDRHRLTRDQYEFQMLLGVRPRIGDTLVSEGHRLRIYVPFGRQWYAYSMRRLQENPKIAGYIAADTIGRLIPGHNGR